MNYIYHLNSFFAKADNQDWLTPHHHCLYLTLFRIWNQTGFKETFVIYRDEVMKKAKIGSKTTYYRCLKELENAGYLQYHSPRAYEAPTITMTRFMCTKKGTDRVPDMNPASPTNGPQQVLDMGHIPKRDNQTLSNNNSKLRSIPTQEEVNQFFQKHQCSPFTAISFWYQYESKNWYCNGSPIKDWQALARKWVSDKNSSNAQNTKDASRSNGTDQKYNDPF
jgi:hypothetical protein